MMFPYFDLKKTDKTIPIHFLSTQQLKKWMGTQNATTQNWIQTTFFKAEPDTFCVVPDQHGHIQCVLYGAEENKLATSFAQLATSLPAQTYALDLPPDSVFYSDYCLSWALQTYQFTRYKQPKIKNFPKLFLPSVLNSRELYALIDAIFLIRDLINLPPEDLGPQELADFADTLAKKYKAKIKHIVGEKLLTENFPAIHAVGRASTRAPRLIDFSWGNTKHPKVTLIGKGVCYDSGGLDLKPNRGLKLMKKDMGGAAHVLGLAKLIMELQLPIRLRVLIPAVENVISDRAYKPGDVVQTRARKTIEIGNTDAEGRVILSDALFEAAQEKPRLMIDFATLTGAARVALGTDIPVCFTHHPTLRNDIEKISQQTQDPVWFLPLHLPYRNLLSSSIADINNVGDDTYAGAILAALFLNEFVPSTIPWLHIDLMAWNLRSRPGKPEGGEAMGLRTLFNFLKNFK